MTEALSQDQPGSAPPSGQVLSGAVIQAGGPIDQDTTWDADLVQITASVEVAEGAALTVAAGTRIEFIGFFRLLVRGRLWAVGRPDARIVFKPSAEQEAEGWDGIEFLNVPAALDFSRLEHCLVTGAVARPAQGKAYDRIVGGTARPETGGAVSIVNVNKLVIASCEFTGNRADYGGAVYCGYGSSPVLAGNLFHGNTAQVRGSAVFNVYAYPKLINNTFVNNVCLPESEFFVCGAVENFNGKIVLANNIIRDNATPHYTGCQVVEAKDYYTHGNNIENWLGNETNLDADALFTEAGGFAFRLAEGSPCVDAGVEHPLALYLVPLDPAGNERWCGPVLDMGAFEYCGSVSATGELKAGLTLVAAPNPFNPRIELAFDLPREGRVVVEVFDLQGRRVDQLADRWFEAGLQQVVWTGSDSWGRNVASGTYLVRLRSGIENVNKRITLVR